ncbi:MAG: hypothetical protein HYY13_13550 [Nitrospirae bacterium]|nr:hypothetical protein [Nitrospirota bacterium]
MTVSFGFKRRRHRLLNIAMPFAVGSLLMPACTSLRPPPTYLQDVGLRTMGTETALNPGPRSYPLFEDTKGTLAYRPPTPRELIRARVAADGGIEAVSGEACRDRLILPVLMLKGEPLSLAINQPFYNLAGVYGDAGYAGAIEKARAMGKRLTHGREGLLIDVRADLNTLTVFTLFTRQCLRINALYVVTEGAQP